VSDEKEIVIADEAAVLVGEDRHVEVLQSADVGVLHSEVVTSGVIVSPEESAVAVIEESKEILIAGGDQGPQGIQGLPGQGGSAYFTFTAQGPIGGHRAVVSVAPDKVGYADNANPAHANAVLGITLGAADDGAEIQVQGSGEITEPSWNWTLQQPVFLSTNGQLTQTCPATGFVLILGTPTAPTKLMVDIKLPFVTEA
jgi:hypothetical protein